METEGKMIAPLASESSVKVLLRVTDAKYGRYTSD